MNLEHLIPEIDETIVLTENEIARRETKRAGAGYQLASFVRSLRIMQDHIRDDSLSVEQRESFYSGLGRGMLDEWDFTNGPIGTKILDISREFAGLPPIRFWEERDLRKVIWRLRKEIAARKRGTSSL